MFANIVWLFFESADAEGGRYGRGDAGNPDDGRANASRRDNRVKRWGARAWSVGGVCEVWERSRWSAASGR
jgi:hypothetical protein